MSIRTADAVWEGTLRDGRGNVHFAHGQCDEPYSFRSRFTEQLDATNPEELIGAAHAGCYSMALSGLLEQAGFKPERIHTSARVHLERLDGGYRITAVDLETEARVPGMDAATFLARADEAKATCPVSRALAVPIAITSARLI